MQKRKDADFPNVLKHLKIYNFFFFLRGILYYIILIINEMCNLKTVKS